MNIGDYVRTKNGISKIVAFYSNAIFNDKNKRIENNSIIKSSPNIIELIEVGDLVKIEYYSLRYDERVERLFEVTYKDKEYLNLENSKCDFMLINKEFIKHDKALEPVIKSIVTKEQFKSMEYKL